MPRLSISLFWLIAVVLPGCSPEGSDQPSQHDFLELSIEERRKPENATASFVVAHDLQVALFAAEPLVVNPTNMDIDHRGRVWVLESPNYGKPQDQRSEQGGRIAILEDTNGDGRADKRTLYYQGEDVETALGIAVLGSKVYVTRSPNLLVFTDKDGDDQPDSKEKLITGMGKPGDHSSHAIVFGPDGKFYWNMGNYAGPVKDASGNIIVDKMGKPVEQYGQHYLGGMVFRCNPDISEFEVLAHNFRNNYEVAVDSYGTMWQSDNDDDGNKSVRINYVMEYGNYGYLDEITRQSWGSYRTNIETEIERRHWHQNDPGVVPNLLITGAGSPAGITVYEGDLLPAPYRGQMLHVDAGPNVARAYPVTPAGAGYTADILNLVKTELDQWFRPVDITTAPDGSVFIADWYDPIVGGGAAGEFDRGRIFRVAPDTEEYSGQNREVKTVEEAIEALKSPNMATRYLGWNALHSRGEAAEAALMGLYSSDNPIYQARALWLLGKIAGKSQQYIDLGLSSDNPDIRVAAVRLARQASEDFLGVAAAQVEDPSPAVRRELAIGLHPFQTVEAAQVWTALAQQHDGVDRWYLEALGIGAANNWKHCLNNWKNNVEDGFPSPAAKDIIWRSRVPQSMELLAGLIRHEKTEEEELLRYFRAFDFLDFQGKNQVLISLLEGDHEHQDQIRVLALQHLDTKNLSLSPKLLSSLDKALAQIQNTPEFINLISKFELKNKTTDLLEMTIAYAGEPLGIEASKVILNEFEGASVIEEAMNQSEQQALAMVKSIQYHGGTKSSLDILKEVVMDQGYPFETRKEAVIGLGKSWPGETELLACVKQPSFDQALHPAAASVLFNVYRREIQEEASLFLERPGSSAGSPLPPIRTLIASNGNKQNGGQVFDTYCQTCHVVENRGTAFGPALTQIGSKLSREGLYRAIIYPNEGINHGYHGSVVKLTDGTSIVGIIESETTDFIEIKLMGGVKNKIPRADIESMEQSPKSLMPNLSTTISEEQLVDLVEYLSSLRSS
jgi:putative membrane-bound dehydrogenase-like protein